MEQNVHTEAELRNHLANERSRMQRFDYGATILAFIVMWFFLGTLFGIITAVMTYFMCKSKTDKEIRECEMTMRKNYTIVPD